jgi:ribosomal protein S18 acetylase RimI-like enzyme
MIRRAVHGDEAAVRELRLAALRDSPDAFGSTLEREQARTAQDWESWIDTGATFLAESGRGEPLGLAVGIATEDGASAELLSMWVAPPRRGTGIADDLVREIVAWAVAQGVSELRLKVTTPNRSARRLYERHGFRLTGIEVSRARDGILEQEMQLVLSPKSRS